jgi:tripartite-type tricarboxylate transporter receptor subunit TctC
MVVPFGPGGANDLIARAAAEAVSKRLGQPIIIENKPGAGAIIGAEYVAKAKPDGYTWLIGGAGVVTNSMIRNDMPYPDSDLIPVGMIAVAPSVIAVHPSIPVSTPRSSSRGRDAAGRRQLGDGGRWQHAALYRGNAARSGNAHHYRSYRGCRRGHRRVCQQCARNVGGRSYQLPQVKGGKRRPLTRKRITAYNTLPTAKGAGFSPGVEIGHWRPVAGRREPRRRSSSG